LKKGGRLERSRRDCGKRRFWRRFPFFLNTDNENKAARLIFEARGDKIKGDAGKRVDGGDEIDVDLRDLLVLTIPLTWRGRAIPGAGERKRRKLEGE